MLEGESIDKAFFEMIWWWSFFYQFTEKVTEMIIWKSFWMDFTRKCLWILQKRFEWIPNILEILHEKIFNGFHEKDLDEITHLLLVWICRFNMDKSGAEKKTISRKLRRKTYIFPTLIWSQGNRQKMLNYIIVHCMFQKCHLTVAGVASLPYCVFLFLRPFV